MRFMIAAILIFAVFGCAQNSKTSNDDLARVIAGDHRSPENRARDMHRHPQQTLEFFEVEPEMTVVEVSPGSGWYTEILAPYLSGKLYLAAFDDQSPREYFRNANKKLKMKIAEHKKAYGDVEFTVLEMPNRIGPIAPANSVDRVLTFRNVHNWMKAGKAEAVFKEFHRVLKKGGILGVVEHRANKAKPKDPKAQNGYVHTEQVLALAKKVGFELVDSSEVNANPKDSADHPKGVWTLPPRLRGEAKNRTKYQSIGESDRMTLKFKK